MGDNVNWTAGEILWQDLTVENALEVRDFFRAVVGWDYIPEDMGSYDDYHMLVMPTGAAWQAYATREEKTQICLLCG